MGAKLACPGKTVVNVMGDAAIGMAGMDIETAVRGQIPIITVVLNNGVMTNYHAAMLTAAERYGSTRLGGNYSELGAALGAHSERIKQPRQIAAVVQRAQQANQEGRPALVEMITCEKKAFSKFWPDIGWLCCGTVSPDRAMFVDRRNLSHRQPHHLSLYRAGLRSSDQYRRQVFSVSFRATKLFAGDSRPR